MATININPLDKISQEHAMYILRALQTVKTQVVFNAGEIASEKGIKVNSVVKQFSTIKKRYNLNIATTAVGYSHGKASCQKSKATSSATTKLKAIEWHDKKESESDNIETPARTWKSPRVPKPIKREHDFEYDYGDFEDEDDDPNPSPAKKRMVESVCTSDEEFSKQDRYASDESEGSFI